MSSFRPVAEIEQDFADLLASHLPLAIARDKLERLWDETNIAAAQLMPTTQMAPYISLLNRMQDALETRYHKRRSINGNTVRRA